MSYTNFRWEEKKNHYGPDLWILGQPLTQKMANFFAICRCTKLAGEFPVKMRSCIAHVEVFFLSSPHQEDKSIANRYLLRYGLENTYFLPTSLHWFMFDEVRSSFVLLYFLGLPEHDQEWLKIKIRNHSRAAFRPGAGTESDHRGEYQRPNRSYASTISRTKTS